MREGRRCNSIWVSAAAAKEREGTFWILKTKQFSLFWNPKYFLCQKDDSHCSLHYPLDNFGFVFLNLKSRPPLVGMELFKSNLGESESCKKSDQRPSIAILVFLSLSLSLSDGQAGDFQIKILAGKTCNKLEQWPSIVIGSVFVFVFPAVFVSVFVFASVLLFKSNLGRQGVQKIRATTINCNIATFRQIGGGKEEKLEAGRRKGENFSD